MACLWFSLSLEITTETPQFIAVAQSKTTTVTQQLIAECLLSGLSLETTTFLHKCATVLLSVLWPTATEANKISSVCFTAQLAGKARQLGCLKIILDHVHVYLYIYVCALWISSLLVVYDAIDNASSSRATRTEN